MEIDYYGVRVNSEGAEARAAFGVCNSERGIVELARRNRWLDFNIHQRVDTRDWYTDECCARYRNGERVQ